MKITGIEVERFGVWSQVSLPVRGPGLTVYYGPNEAGKTTLLRFLRGVLYGFRAEAGPSGRRRWPRSVQAGTLRVEHRHAHYELHRVAHDDGPGLLSIRGADESATPEELLAGTDANVFESVFAIGLPELQELATLNDSDVAETIYAVSLGPHGRRLLDVQQQIDAERQRLAHSESGTGELADLIWQHDELTAEIEARSTDRHRHMELCRQRHRLESDLTDLKQRLAGMQSQLRGHMYLERIWRPWRQVREYRRELASLPEVRDFPEDGLRRLDLLESEIASHGNCRTALLHEVRQLLQQAEAHGPDPELLRHAPSIQMLLEQRADMRDVEQRLASLDALVAESQRLRDEHLTALGDAWTIQRLHAVDTSPSAHVRIVSQARAFQSAMQRRQRLRRRYRQLAESCRVRELELKERLQQLGCSGDSVDEPLIFAKQQLAELVELGRLQLRLAELQHRREGIEEQLSHAQARFALPRWVYGVLGFFGLAGIALAAAGLLTGITTSVLVGTIYTLLGVTAAGITWAFKTQYEREARQHAEQLQLQRRDNETAQRKLHDQIAAFAATETPPLDNDGELLSRAAQRLAELEQLQREFQRIDRVRRRLSEYRARFRILQREVGTARKNWCETLNQLGYGETVRIEEAFETWQRVLDAREQHQRWLQLCEEQQHLRQQWDAFSRRVAELGRQMEADPQTPFDALDDWERELRHLAGRSKERRRCRQEARRRRQEAAEYERQIDELKLQRSALLVQAGAVDRDSFEERAELFHRRRELEQLLEQADEELEAAAQTEPDLAIVEEDLRRFDPESNSEAIRTLNLELEALEQDLELVCEELGRVKQELKTLEADRRVSRLRLEREQVATQLKRAAEQWFAVELAAESIEDIRARFERTQQPAVLAAAAPILNRLTCGKYGNAWTPLGERHLCVDDDRQQSLPVEHLSGGTREQLFLAIRLALVEQLARQGVELPLVLDDVTVNFDQQRTEAAVDLLIELSARGQQILLFTSHLHLAHLFESRGHEPVWLPAHHAAIDDCERRAG